MLAAETIEREVFPGLKLNGIIDVNFKGFIKVVDTLGCAYVNVDHRYYNEQRRLGGNDYSAINLQPGYQKLCYENALSYVRYRHTDSDFVRVARQQDFLRDLREQISPATCSARSTRSPRPSGTRSRSTFHASGQRADRTREADRLLAGQAAAPGQVPDDQRQRADRRRLLRDLDARRSSKTTLDDFLHGHEQVRLAVLTAPAHASSAPSHTHQLGAALAARARPRTRPRRGESEAVKAAARTCPSRCSTRRCRPAPAEQQTVRAYTLRTTSRQAPPRLRRRLAAEHASAATTTSRAPTG